MPYWQLFYHIITATKGREPRITQEIETNLFRLIRNKSTDLGATVFALNGIADHIHLIAAIPPKLALTTFIGQVKGFSSAEINRYDSFKDTFYWQDEYGVFSFDKKRLPNLIDYVERQKEHHNSGSIIPVLERYSEEPQHQIKEVQSPYLNASEDDFPF